MIDWNEKISVVPPQFRLYFKSLLIMNGLTKDSTIEDYDEILINDHRFAPFFARMTMAGTPLKTILPNKKHKYIKSFWYRIHGYIDLFKMVQA